MCVASTVLWCAILDANVGERYPVCGHVWPCMLGVLRKVCLASGVVVGAMMYAAAGTLYPVIGHV